jgi:hypothetical protein
MFLRISDVSRVASVGTVVATPPRWTLQSVWLAQRGV